MEDGADSNHRNTAAEANLAMAEARVGELASFSSSLMNENIRMRADVATDAGRIDELTKDNNLLEAKVSEQLKDYDRLLREHNRLEEKHRTVSDSLTTALAQSLSLMADMRATHKTEERYHIRENRNLAKRLQETRTIAEAMQVYIDDREATLEEVQASLVEEQKKVAALKHELEETQAALEEEANKNHQSLKQELEQAERKKRKDLARERAKAANGTGFWRTLLGF